MADAATRQLYEIHEQRIRDAVALKTPDRVPVVPNGPAWPGRAMGVKISEIATNPESATGRSSTPTPASARSTASRAPPITSAASASSGSRG